MINFTKLLSCVVLAGLVTASMPAKAKPENTEFPTASAVMYLVAGMATALPLVVLSLEKDQESSEYHSLSAAYSPSDTSDTSSRLQILFNFTTTVPFAYRQNPITAGMGVGGIIGNVALGQADKEYGNYAYVTAAASTLGMLTFCYLNMR